MRILLDGRVLEGAASTLREAIELARRSAGDRFLIQMVADGVPVSAEDLDDPPARSPYAQVLEITTANPEDLVRTVLFEAADMLEQVKPMHADVAQRVQRGELSSAMEGVAQVFQAWGDLRQAIDLAMKLGPCSAASAEDLNSMLTDLARRLTDLKQAISTKDWVGLGDVLAYDMDHSADRFRSWLLAAAGQAA